MIMQMLTGVYSFDVRSRRRRRRLTLLGHQTRTHCHTLQPTERTFYECIHVYIRLLMAVVLSAMCCIAVRQNCAHSVRNVFALSLQLLRLLMILQLHTYP